MDGWHLIEGVQQAAADSFRLKRSMERFESGNYSFVGLYMLDAGIQALMLCVGIPAVEQHALALGGRLREELVRLGAEVLTPADPARRAGTLPSPSPTRHAPKRSCGPPACSPGTATAGSACRPTPTMTRRTSPVLPRP